MRRLLLSLPLCLAVGSDRQAAPAAVPRHATAVAVSEAALPTESQFVELARTNPVECLKAAARRYRREFRGYHSLMQKQERIAGKLNPVEVIDVWHRDEPHSVYLNWKGKPAGLAESVLYVDGAHANQMLCRPYGLIARKIAGNIVTRDPESREAKAGARVSIREFGLLKAVERHIVAWDEAKANGTLHVEYLGLQEIPNTDGPCHVFRRTYDPPEGPEQIGKLDLALDQKHWLQVSSRLYDATGKVLGLYSFKDVEVNPVFAPERFDKEQLNR